MHSFFGDPRVSAIAISVAPRQGIARCIWLFFGVGDPTAFLVRPNVLYQSITRPGYIADMTKSIAMTTRGRG